MSPLEYMLEVMNDPGSDVTRRDRMAIAAAPFVHSRAEGMKGKKEAFQDAASALVDGAGDEWGSDLNPNAMN